MFDDIARLRTTRTRSISPENPDGSTGGGARATEGTGAHAARELGRGWKVSPSVVIGGHSTHDLAVIDEPGRITHIWLTTHRDHWRSLVLRAYWDGDHEPAIEVPVGDFFASGWGRFAQVSSAMVAVNPHGGFNSYWPMPFGSSAHLTLENLSPDDATVYYQVTYDTGPGVAGAEDGFGHLHAQFRRSNPLVEGETHPILRGVAGRGHYAGTYLAWGVNSTCWWGEGEVKFYLDGDDEFPSIAGTGTEDYFGGAWNFDVPDAGYTEFSTPYLGLPQVIRPDGGYESQQRFGMYRWHVPDPITFTRDITVDVQALGWRPRGRYRQLTDDISSVGWFYLDRTSTTRPELPSANALEP
ncbi:glycoside hydrolase family 172 protein [Propionibacteriaceae bacterium Y2011]